MLWHLFRLAALVLAVALCVGWVRLGLSRARRTRREIAKALADYQAGIARLSEAFRQAAQASGKPRGLNWVRCDLEPTPPTLARDKVTGELVGLAGVTIAFEAAPGGDMEEVEAVGDLRDGTAVLVWRDGQWTTDGRAVFNLSPEQTLHRYQGSLAALD